MAVTASGRTSPATGVHHQSYSIGTVLGLLWLCVLGLSLLLSTYNSFQLATTVQEFAYASDRFGYLNMAKQIRYAVRGGHLPQFWIESPQMSVLIDFLKAHNVPVTRWLDLVAPLCYHYFPRTGHIGANPPPGTGLILALFPEGKAVVRLNKLVIGLLLTTGITGLILAGIRKRWIEGGFVTLAVYLGFQVIATISSWSFSINAVMAPLLLMFVSIFVTFILETDPRHVRTAWFASLSAGLFWGLACLIRLPVALLGPGLVVLLWPASWRMSVRNRLLPFMAGTAITGILPVLAFQYQETGAWYLPTYGPSDASPPSLLPLRRNLVYYLGNGPGSTDNWAFFVSFIAVLALVLYRRSSNRPTGLLLTWNRLVGSAVLLWGIPMAYFLTHPVAIPYYLVPSTFGSVVLLALGVLTIEWFAPRTDSGERSTKVISLRLIALILSLAPGIVVLSGGWPPSVPSVVRADTLKSRIHKVTLPRRLTDDRAWVWANYLTGTFWYYGNKPAFDIYYSDAQTRASIYGFVFRRAEPQYVVEDSPWMEPIIDEIYQMGGILESIPGGVDGSPYFLIHWPTGGPRNVTRKEGT
jgi:hypothetical protein